MKIAPLQRRDLDLLRGSLDRAEHAAGRRARPAFDDLRTRVDAWATRVAVIGQVKAGKSTFLNALLRQHDFLPSDINPWTSVVTNIRINVPSDPPLGASFEFFDDADWDEIVNGGSRIRQLTESLLPGFDTELLKKQSEEMRARAQKRLGNYFHTLLGSKHEYDFLTPDLLKRYVCAGPGSDDGLTRESLGRYAAITKVANVHMRLPEFQVPTIVTDTPGVNDPFLVRDEFTCRSLDKSDVFVVVLAAHQALTEVDIALIRILAKQDAKDVVIFVNRIDELDDYAAEVPRVLADVSKRLRLAIPGIEFRITAGSAWMSDLTLRTDEDAEAERARLDTPELARYLQSRHGHVPADRLDRLALASGLDEIRSVLSDVIDTGVGAHQLAHLQESLRAEIGGTLFTTRRERDGLQAQVQSVTGEVAGLAAEQAEAELAEIAALRDRLEAHVENGDAKIGKLVTRAWSKLEADLLSRIDAFTEGQRATFEDRLFREGVSGRGGRTLDIDLTPLQVALEQDVMAHFDKSRALIDTVLTNVMHACRQTVLDRFDDPSELITLEDLPFEQFTSTLAMAKKSLRVDLIADRSWAFWRSPAINAEKSLAALRAIAAAELQPSVEKILRAFNEAQVERVEGGSGRIRVMLRMIDATIAERTRALRTEKAEMERIATSPEARGAIIDRMKGDMEVLQRRILELSAIDGALVRTQEAQAA